MNMAAINEFIKAIRTQHSLMVGFCAILIIFSFNTQTDSKYGLMLDELAEVDSAFSVNPYEVLDSTISERFSSTPFIYQTESGGIVDMSMAFFIRSALVSVIPDKSWTIQQIREFVMSGNRIITSVPILTAQQYYSLLDTAIAAGDTLMPSLVQLTYQNLKGTTKKGEFSSRHMLQFYEHRNLFDSASPDFRLYTELQDINIYWSIDDVRSKVPELYDATSYPNWYGNVFLNDSTSLTNILSKTFLGCGECYKMTVSEAIGHLKEKKKKDEQKVSALGLDLHGSAVFLVGPLILIVLIIYLWIMARNLHAHLHSEHPSGEIFPWFGIVNNALSQSATFFSIVILPSLALWTVWVRSLDGLSLIMAIYAALNILTLAVSILCFISLMAIGKHLSIVKDGISHVDIQ